MDGQYGAMINTFGPLIRKRRADLGLSQHDVSARGGPSHQTLRNIETGAELPPLRDFTVVRLETALALQQGTIRSHLREGTPLEPLDLKQDPTDLQSQLLAMLVATQPKPVHQRHGVQSSLRSVRLPDAMWAALKARAEADRETTAYAIREGFAQYLDLA